MVQFSLSSLFELEKFIFWYSLMWGWHFEQSHDRFSWNYNCFPTWGSPPFCLFREIWKENCVIFLFKSLKTVFQLLPESFFKLFSWFTDYAHLFIFMNESTLIRVISCKLFIARYMWKSVVLFVNWPIRKCLQIYNLVSIPVSKELISTPSLCYHNNYYVLPYNTPFPYTHRLLFTWCHAKNSFRKIYISEHVWN
jgi:hypothetical protein